MKKRIMYLFLAMLLTVCSGCGTSLAEMTETEEEIVVRYAANVIAKYNHGQSDGIVKIYTIKGEEEEEEEVEETVEEPGTEEMASGDLTAGGDLSETGEEIAVEDAVEATLTEALGITDLSFTWESVEVAADYSYNDAYLITPSTGKQFAICNISVSNTGEQSVLLDMMSANMSITLQTDSGSYANVSTISINDLSTYYGQIPVGDGDDVVLFFEIPSDTEITTENVSLIIENTNGTYRVKM